MFKRVMDIVISVMALIIFSPILLVVAVLVRKNLGSPVLFRQPRPGMHARSFNMLKFRSMNIDKDLDGNLLPDAQRLPHFGQVLRSSSLDELPGLINVLRGNMSIVGPRPLLVEYLPLYDHVQKRRHEVRPGITGWAQVNGRNTISWEQKFEYDVWYVDNQSLWLDIKIILLTAMKVVRRADINSDGEATMTKFTGSKAKDKECE
jgi:lipopolysaccharide/colanic/teichoic acid biosynthesis glycosyltransferase